VVVQKLAEHNKYIKRWRKS